MTFDSNKLEKLTITPFDSGGQRMEEKQIIVLFNPNSYSIEKSVTWTTPPTSRTACEGKQTNQLLLDAPALTFGGGGARRLNLELFYDVTEPTAGQKDVRVETDKIVSLTRIQRDRPPTVEVSWGGASTADFPFVGVISNLTQRFTLFRSTGQALRATLNVSFTEFLNQKVNLPQTNPKLTTHMVRRGDSLVSVAARIYSDPALWRVIAEANQLDDPLRLEIGRRLTIPKI